MQDVFTVFLIYFHPLPNKPETVENSGKKTVLICKRRVKSSVFAFQNAFLQVCKVE